jgi:predicted kinase
MISGLCLRIFLFVIIKTEELITDIINSSVISALNKGLNVIIDNTNVRDRYINQFIDLVITKANVEFQVMDITVDEAIERDSKREKSVLITNPFLYRKK